MAGIAENLSNPVTAQRTMGVDLNKEVSDRVKTYRSNPKKLQERYQMSQELLDLLALQREVNTKCCWHKNSRDGKPDWRCIC